MVSPHGAAWASSQHGCLWAIRQFTWKLTSFRLNPLVDNVEAMFDDLALEVTWCCFRHILGDSHKSPLVSKTGNIDSISFFTLWQNTHNINLIIINSFVYGSVALSTFTLLCGHHHYPCLELFLSSQTETSHPLNTNSSSLGLTSC